MDRGKLNTGQLGQGLGGFFGGLFGNSGEGYEDYQRELQKYLGQAQGWQFPFYQAGAGAIPQYQEWLGGQKDPSQFINNLMGQYQESPWAKYQQEQAVRRGQNAGSGLGLTGSTPLAQFMQQNARNISSQDMEQWLGHVLGINTQYGQGVNNLMTGGQGAANNLSTITSDLGKYFAEARKAQTERENKDYNNMWGGLFTTAGSALPMFL